MSFLTTENRRSCERTHTHSAHEWAHGRGNYVCTGNPQDDAQGRLWGTESSALDYETSPHPSSGATWGPWFEHGSRCSCAVCR